MSRGRKPKPTAIKAAEGNRGKRKLPVEPPFADAPPDIPEPPVILSKSAREVWDKIYMPLQRAGVLKETDLYSLAMYCAAAGRYEDAAYGINFVTGGEKGLGLLVDSRRGQRENPLVGTMRRAALDMQALGSDFGLSPVARAKLGIADPIPENPLDEFLNPDGTPKLKSIPGGKKAA